MVPFDGKCHLEWNNETNTFDYKAKDSTLYVSTLYLCVCDRVHQNHLCAVTLNIHVH